MAGKKNPELEELRMRALHSTVNRNQTEEIEEVIEATRRIHAAFLFHSPKTLQSLLRAIGETNSADVEAGWQSFGDKLGLDVSILRVINNNQFNHEDPVYNTLLHYVQYEDATIGKVVRALLEMGRLDVIMRTKSILQQLSDVILNHEQELMRASHLTSDYGSSESNDSSHSEITVSNEIMIKPSLIPDAPFIIKNVQAAPLLSTLLLQGVVASKTNVICSPTFSEALAHETLLQASPVPVAGPASPPATSRPKQRCARKVMLTFAADGASFAEEVAVVLRRLRGTARIGVVVLGEQRSYLQSDPYMFITSSFHQVDYVVPIITEGYLKTVLRRVHGDGGAGGADCVDANYVPFIYQTMVQDYTRRGCLNEKVRCLIPDHALHSILEHLMMAGPLFAAWEKTSRADLLAERILASNA